MYELVEFLVREGYCYSEKEAVKIIESASDNFYNYLVEESGSYSDNARKIGALKTELTNPRTSSDRQQKIRIALAKLGRENRINSQGSTVLKKIQGRETKPTSASGIAQTTDIGVTKTAEAKAKQRGIPMTGSSINNPRVASAASREASRLTGTTAEVGRAGGSNQFTGVVRTGKYSDMQVGGRATASTPNKGQSRTGARFPRQAGE